MICFAFYVAFFMSYFTLNHVQDGEKSKNYFRIFILTVKLINTHCKQSKKHREV